MAESHRNQRGYELVNDDPAHAEERAKFDKILEDFPPITEEHPFWKTKKGKQFKKPYTNPKSVQKHLYNHKDYTFYDEGLNKKKDENN